MAKKKKQDAWDTAMDVIADRVDAACKAAGHEQVLVFYSAYDDDEEGNPIDNLDKVAVKGKVVLIGEKDDFYGGEESRSYVSEVLENPTWLQVAVCANAMIQRVLDEHHVFLEGLSRPVLIGSRQLEQTVRLIERKGVTAYEFDMGS